MARNTYRFRKDDIYDDGHYANIGGAVERAIAELPASERKLVQVKDTDREYVHLFAEGDYNVDLYISSKRDVVWTQFHKNGHESRDEFTTGTELLDHVKSAIIDAIYYEPHLI